MLMPDVGGQKSSFESANAGLDYGSGWYWSESIIEAGLRNGSLTEARFDDIADSNIIGSFYVGLDKNQAPSVADTTANRHVMTNNKQRIRGIAAESLVLLKNTPGDNVGLPLAKGNSIAVFGTHAGFPLAGPNLEFSALGSDRDTFQGHLTSSSGSGAGSVAYVITTRLAMTLRQREDDGMLWWITNDTFTESSSSGFTGGSPPGGGGGGGSGLTGLGSGTGVAHSYANYAASSDACIVFLNALAGEGADRGELPPTKTRCSSPSRRTATTQLWSSTPLARA